MTTEKVGMTKYSILIPVYNVEEYLKECLDSVVNQDFPKNEYEIIITDDGSTDGSSTICDEYGKLYNNVRIVHQRNQGLMMARKTGVLAAEGDYLIFVDSDDFVDADMLKIIDEVIRVENPDFLMHGYKNTYKDIEKECTITEYEQERLTKLDFIYRFARNSNLNSIVCKVVSRRILVEHIDEIYRNVNIAEDMLQTIYLTKYSDDIILLKATPYHYRIQRGSMIHQQGLEKIEKKLETYNTIKLVISDIFSRMTEWSQCDIEQIAGLFDAGVVNDIMENIYKYNCLHNVIDGKKLDVLTTNSLIVNTDVKYLRQRLTFYNMVRLYLFKHKYYKLLRLIDRILRMVQKIVESVEGAEWY